MASAIQTGQLERPNLIVRYFQNIVKDKFPRKIKRLVYMSSVFSLIYRSQNPDLNLIRKLNDIMKLANNANSYLLPMYVKSLIWKELEVIQTSNGAIALSNFKQYNLTDEDYREVASYFANKIPDWLRYCSTSLLTEETVKLLKNTSYLLADIQETVIGRA